MRDVRVPETASGFGMTRQNWSCFAYTVAAVAAVISSHRVVAADDGPVTASAESIAACAQLPFSIQLTVKNVKSAKGIVTVDLHNDDADRWLKKSGRIGRVRVPALEGETRICIPVDHAGTYAFALYHDRDANLKLNKNWIGLPSEPFGVSNNAPIRLGPPSLKDASLQVTGPLTAATVTLSN
jgi:uncharacterized protein (DUF2141 family)